MFDHWSHFILAPIAAYMFIFVLIAWPRWKEEARINALYIEERKRRKQEERDASLPFT